MVGLIFLSLKLNHNLRKHVDCKHLFFFYSLAPNLLKLIIHWKRLPSQQKIQAAILNITWKDLDLQYFFKYAPTIPWIGTCPLGHNVKQAHLSNKPPPLLPSLSLTVGIQGKPVSIATLLITFNALAKGESVQENKKPPPPPTMHHSNKCPSFSAEIQKSLFQEIGYWFFSFRGLH